MERIRLDPLLNQRVIFKIRGHEPTMDATILRYDATGYWIEGGTLVEYLSKAELSDPHNQVRYLEIKQIEWLQRYPKEQK